MHHVQNNDKIFVQLITSFFNHYFIFNILICCLLFNNLLHNMNGGSNETHDYHQVKIIILKQNKTSLVDCLVLLLNSSNKHSIVILPWHAVTNMLPSLE